MSQAIVTRFLGATNRRGARIKATCQAGSLTVAWDHAKDVTENHNAAALALALRLEWVTKYDLHKGRCHIIGGGLPDGRGNAYVLVEDL